MAPAPPKRALTIALMTSNTIRIVLDIFMNLKKMISK